MECNADFDRLKDLLWQSKISLPDDKLNSVKGRLSTLKRSQPFDPACSPSKRAFKVYSLKKLSPRAKTKVNLKALRATFELASPRK